MTTDTCFSPIVQDQWFEETKNIIKELIPVLGTNFSIEPGCDEGTINGKYPICILWVEINWEGEGQNTSFGNVSLQKSIPNVWDSKNKKWIGTKSDAKECAARLEEMLRESVVNDICNKSKYICSFVLPINEADEKIIDNFVNTKTQRNKK